MSIVRTYTARLCALIPLLFVGVAEAIPPVYAPGGWALDGYAAAEYFASGQALRGNPDFTYEYKGARWFFMSAANRDAFAANPEQYAPQYGGHCSLAMCGCKDSRGDPEAWLIHKGKLYLNGSARSRDTFKNRLNRCIRQADRCWEALVDKE